jgi:hypothetical protein
MRVLITHVDHTSANFNPSRPGANRREQSERWTIVARSDEPVEAERLGMDGASLWPRAFVANSAKIRGVRAIGAISSAPRHPRLAYTPVSQR